MDANQVALLKKEQRRQGRSKVRQALFVSDYIFYKHFDIYQQAAQLYNEINEIYPRKPDLRRTEEFKNWRMDVMGQPTRVKRKSRIRRPYVFPTHANIPIADCIGPHVNFTVVDQSESPHLQPESPHLQPESPHIQSESPHLQPESPHLQPESPHLQPESPHLQPESPHLQPESPHIQSESPHLQSESPHLQPESPHIQPESPDIQPESPHIQPESPCVQPESSVHQNVKKGKVMQLKIPLMKPPAETLRIVTEEDTPSLEPSLYTETLQIVTEEVLEEDTSSLEPSLYEEISPEVIERIVKELSLDPGLKDILTTVEEQVEFHQLGMDLDMPDDRLENELENLIFW